MTRVLSVALLLSLSLSLPSSVPAKDVTTQDRPALVALCAPDEPGDKVAFWGRVLDYQGRPLAKAAVVAYQADRKGLYNPPGGDTRVPRIRNVAVTDAEGRYGFLTVRPGAYPEHTEPAHIHLVVGVPAHDVRFMDIWFEDDPLITPARRERARNDPAIAIVALEKDRDGTLTFQQDIRLESN